MSQKIYLTVKEFAEFCGVTPRTLKYYEELGLLKPDHVDVNNNYRYYHWMQADQVSVIKLLQDYGLSLTEIQEMSAETSFHTIEERLTQQRVLLADRIERLQLQEHLVNETLRHLQASKNKMSTPIVLEVERRIVYTPNREDNHFLVNYLSTGFQNGAKVDAKTGKALGTFQDITEASGAQVMRLVNNLEAEIQTIKGMFVGIYHDNYPQKSPHIVKMLEEEAKKYKIPFDYFYCEQIVEHLQDGGLFLYYVVKAEEEA